MSTMLWKDVPTLTVDVGGTPFAYRELGARSDVPVVFLHRLSRITQPVFVANGDHDLMVASSHSADTRAPSWLSTA